MFEYLFNLNMFVPKKVNIFAPSFSFQPKSNKNHGIDVCMNKIEANW